MGRAWILWAVLSVLSACGGGGGGSSPSNPSTGLPPTATAFEIASTETGIAYGVQVWLPAGYDPAGPPLHA